jgi:AbiV family abortive infection protein
MNKKLDGYKGRLNSAQVADGINAAARNARRLAEDAETLLNANRFPSAASLAALSIEESGKTSILRALSLAKDDKELVGHWKDYRCHTKKNRAWLLPQLVSKGARCLDDFKPLFSEEAEHPFLLDQVKQIGFYTDCLGQARWSIPDEVVDEHLTRLLVQTAKLLAKTTETTSQEVDLWIKHMGPVWMTDMSEMKKAIVNWYAEMQQKGLALQGDNQMDIFINQGISLK